MGFVKFVNGEFVKFPSKIDDKRSFYSCDETGNFLTLVDANPADPGRFYGGACDKVDTTEIDSLIAEMETDK